MPSEPPVAQQVEDPAPSPRPRSRLTARVRRDVLVDSAAFRLVTSRAERPEPAEVARIDREVDAAVELFERRGWIADPASYHVTPPAPRETRTSRRRSANVRYTSLTWFDGYAPDPAEPGAARVTSHPENQIARAMLLEHRSEPRPWLVVLHGFGMGMPALDLRAFRALHLHRSLGLNLAFLTLPFHGKRNPGPATQPMMPSADVMDTVHGLTQAVWNTRQLIAHLRERTDQPIGVMGLSLGGLVASVVASVDEPHAVVLLVPAIDLPTLMRDAADDVTDVGFETDLIDRSRPLFGPVSPLLLTPRVPLEQRHIVAGTLDRFARPSSQAMAIWHHWEEPALRWYHGGHASVFWSRGVRDSIDESLLESGLAR